MRHKKKLKTVECVNTINSLATITQNIYIIHRKFYFDFFLLYLSPNQAALENSPVTIESTASSLCKL